MSGTSADGLTVCAICPAPFRIIAWKNYRYPPALQRKLLCAFDLRAPQLSELHYELGALYATYVQRFLKETKLPVKQLEVIGSHGQTVYHGPHDKTPNTLQLGESSFLAARFNVPVVSDFRAMDVALGGEGAPLMPFFDELIFGQSAPKILLNIGGVANIAVVGKRIKTYGFDVGPGNSLIDLTARQLLRKPFDKNGTEAARGQADVALVNRWLKHRFFTKHPPKSLDKNAFGEAFLAANTRALQALCVQDRFATLTYFTAAAVAQQISRFVPASYQRELIVSGGGCYNKTLLRFLQTGLPHMHVRTSLDYGIDPQAKESAAFALFAHLALHHRINHCARATGARQNAILGKITPCNTRG